jgi:hypothetical protein
MNDDQLKAYREKSRAESVAYAAKEFKLKVEDVVFYNGGICYSTIVVRSEAAAKKVARKVKGDTVNGGWYDGMPLGRITTEHDAFGKMVWRVMC